MTADQSFRLFEIVNRNFNSEEDARIFVSEPDKLVTERAKEEARQLATKEDLVREVSLSKQDLMREVSLSKQDLLKEINQSKVDMIKWMFGFWVTLVLLILANWFLKH